MACGDSYLYLAVTESGFTFQSPGVLVPFHADEVYEEWRALATRLAKLASEAMKEAGRIECEQTGGLDCDTDHASGGDYPVWNALVPTQNRMYVGLEALPSSFWSTDRAADRAAAQAVIRDALCLLEMSRDAIVKLGGKPPVLPSAPTAGASGSGAVLGLLVVAALLTFAALARGKQAET